VYTGATCTNTTEPSMRGVDAACCGITLVKNGGCAKKIYEHLFVYKLLVRQYIEIKARYGQKEYGAPGR